MKRVLLAVLVLGTGSVWAPASAAAQRIDSPYRFLDHGQHLGVYAGRLGAEEGPLLIGPQPGPLVGARWALRVSGPVAIGAEIGYAATTRTVRDTVFVAADSVFRAVAEADARLLSAMGLIHFSITGQRTWYGLQPGIILGAGAVIDLGSRAPEEEEIPATARYDRGTSFAGQFGASVEWFPSQRISIRGDVRNQLWRVGAPEAFRRTEAGAGLGQSEWTNNLALMAGLSFHF